MTARISPPRAASEGIDHTVMPVILAVAAGHFLNDLMQSLIQAAYPLFKENLGLSFVQIGLITLVFQGTASVLQPLIGLYTDRRPLPYAMALGMGSTGAGLVVLAHTTSFELTLVAVGLIGLGSAIFHPEASRIARLAAGMRPGMAQSVFQVGGNAGAALGPLAAAFIVVARGQGSIQWFAAIAALAMFTLWGVGRWYVAEGAQRAVVQRSRAAAAPGVPATVVATGMFLLVALMFSKMIYQVSFGSYYTFFLIERFGLGIDQSQLALFFYLAAVAAGTVIGGPIGDHIGRRRVILWSIFGALPLTAVLPWLPLVPNVIVAGIAGLIMASSFPAMVVYAQDLMPKNTGMVAGLLFGLAFGIAGVGAAGLGTLADLWGIVTVYQICGFLPAIGIIAILLPDPRIPREKAVGG
ncbi:MAG: MFS transporter [Rubellimicrobium sp.]|nr:MFS transporter [Rubellimicrobium sp.]